MEIIQIIQIIILKEIPKFLETIKAVTPIVPVLIVTVIATIMADAPTQVITPAKFNDDCSPQNLRGLADTTDVGKQQYFEVNLNFSVVPHKTITKLLQDFVSE